MLNWRYVWRNQSADIHKIFMWLLKAWSDKCTKSSLWLYPRSSSLKIYAVMWIAILSHTGYVLPLLLWVILHNHIVNYYDYHIAMHMVQYCYRYRYQYNCTDMPGGHWSI